MNIALDLEGVRLGEILEKENVKQRNECWDCNEFLRDGLKIKKIKK